MPETENYDEVFKKFLYERVQHGDDEIRRYRGVLYTLWKKSKFDSLFPAIDGEALFFGASGAGVMTEGEFPASIPSYTYAVAKMMGYPPQYGGVRGWVDEPEGDKIICELDVYRNTEKYWLYRYNGELKGYIPKLRPFLLARDFHITLEHIIKEERKKIYDEYLTRHRKLDNVEYKYLHAQLQYIQHIRDENLQCKLTDADLSTLHGKLSARSSALRRTEEPTTDTRGAMPDENDVNPPGTSWADRARRMLGLKADLEALKNLAESS